MKIKLSHKLFIGIFIATLTTFIFCFIVVDRLLLERYEMAYRDRLGELIEELGEELETARLPEVDQLINHFAFENHADVTITSEIADPSILEDLMNVETNPFDHLYRVVEDMAGSNGLPLIEFERQESHVSFFEGANAYFIFDQWGRMLMAEGTFEELTLFLENNEEELLAFSPLQYVVANHDGEAVVVTERFEDLMMFVDLQNFEIGSSRQFEHLFLFNIEQAQVVTEVFEFVNTEANVRHFVTIDMSFAPATHVMNQLREMALPLFIFVVVVSLSIAFFFSYYLSRPIVRISQASSKMKQLKLSERIQIKRQDEIGDLATHLNDMAYQLQRTMENLTEANQKLQSEMLKEKEREKQRKDFFMAVSHELKTPLTILKTQLSGMIEQMGIYQDREQYLRKSHGTTELMSDMVANLLKILHLNSDEIRLNLEVACIGTLVEKICVQYESFATEKSISLTHYLEPHLMAQIDKVHFSTVVSNIISNAIRHTPAGHLVDIQLTKEGNTCVLTVENYGIHLPNEVLGQLFEPFYRTDKSRSRYTGGSGLGLYITKNILELHGFSYELVNSSNGVVFTIEIPLTDDNKPC